MSEDNKTAVIFCLATIIAIAVIAFSSAWYYANLNRLAMENGYEQQTIPGQIGVYWLKSDKAELE